MTVGGENLKDKKVEEARKTVVEWLKEQGLMEKEEDVTQNVGTAERTGGIIEPLPKLQWFIRVDKKFKLPYSELKNIKSGQEVTLKELMRSVVESGEIKITPDHFEKIYFHWIDNLRDWCISRQIWYGHRIPVWYKDKEIHTGLEQPKDSGWAQDEDTLDTWFSSGLWTFSTLGWPEKTIDFKTFHPTTVLETGYDILFFWVARMILMSTTLVGQIPFKNVYLHGIVRAADKQKMSKSKGNVVDPLEWTAKYGTDALRFGLIFNTAPGTDMPLAEDKIKGMKHFANKLWNIARYILANSEKLKVESEKVSAVTEADKEILAKLDQTIKTSTDAMEKFLLHEAAQEIYQFTWRELADVYIEASKAQLADEKLKENTQKILLHNLITILKLLHPFMPFVTEELWAKLQEEGLLKEKELLMITSWPK
jgi:valyl-tRNA synthetase